MADETKTSPRLRFGIRWLMVLVTLGAVSIFGYQKWVLYQRIENAREWIDNQQKGEHYVPSSRPSQVSDDQVIPTLVTGVFHLETLFEKTWCLKMMAELYSEDCTEPLVQIALGSKDPEVQRIAVHLLALTRDVEVLDRLEPLATSPDPLVRAARLDCIGFTRLPTYDQSLEGNFWGKRFSRNGKIDCSPAISVVPVFSGQPVSDDWTFFPSPEPDGHNCKLLETFPAHYRQELEQVMLAEGASQAEREAAARAIVAWPPEDYQLRYAEWGVWINSGGKFQLVDSIIDEIPKFVHRPANKLESFVDRLSIPMLVTKPVIHLTCDQSMAIDLDVAFNLGRPWFAYPRPDDFQIIANLTPAGSELPDAVESGGTIEVREGYPWVCPHHRQHRTMGWNDEFDEIAGLGLHWQSAIVSPTKLPWMELPKVDSDPKFQWWKDLRDVECSWVSSLNESERFIYYDGPTQAKSPLDLSYSEEQIEVAEQSIFQPDVGKIFDGWNQVVRHAETLKRDGFFIRVDESGTFGAHVLLKGEQAIDLKELELSGVGDLKASMLDSLKTAGLNDQEAKALMKCWTPAFFEAPGQRVVFFLHKSEYDLMCPMSLRPEPTELARVGLVLTELTD